MENPPFNCWECDRKCGGEDMPAAWAIYDQEGGYWVCEKHYQEIKKEMLTPYPYTL